MPIESRQVRMDRTPRLVSVTFKAPVPTDQIANMAVLVEAACLAVGRELGRTITPKFKPRYEELEWSSIDEELIAIPQKMLAAIVETRYDSELLQLAFENLCKHSGRYGKRLPLTECPSTGETRDLQRLLTERRAHHYIRDWMGRTVFAGEMWVVTEDAVPADWHYRETLGESIGLFRQFSPFYARPTDAEREH